MQTAKLFANGRSQAVRLPREYRFEGEEVFIHREGDRVILSPHPVSWENFFKEGETASEDFLASRNDTPPQERESF
ncbi:MAG: antitoxin [Magnetococcales bacterium]|nr:antitoxin [Magnetococcales bacterium]